MNDRVVTEPFSSGYELVHGAEVETYPQDEAVLDYEVYDRLASEFAAPLIAFVDGIHYVLEREQSIPPRTLVVPERNHDAPETLLIQK